MEIINVDTSDCIEKANVYRFVNHIFNEKLKNSIESSI